MADSSSTSKFSFGRAASGGGLLKPLLGVAAVGGGAFLADQALNDGRITHAFTGSEGYGRAMDAAQGGLSKVWEVASAGGSMIGDMATSQQGNPWMMGIAALGAAIVAWKFAPMLLSRIGGDGFGGSALRGTLGLAIVGLAAFAVAGAVGNLRDDGPEHDANRPLPSATQDSRLQAAPERMDTLTIAPPAAPGAGGP